jgi:uncharacterized protein YgiM (DUF1202 family)
MRIGPGENYRMLCYLDKGTNLEIIGRNSDASWLRIELKSGQICYTLNTSGKKVEARLSAGQQLWISNPSLKISGNVYSVKLVSSPPTETPVVVKVPAQSGSGQDSGGQYP